MTILTHSVAQNNVLGTFSVSITSEVEKRLSAIEAAIAGLSRQQGPPAVSRGELQTLQQIARKVNTIEQRVVVNAPSPNPPGPQPNKQKTEGSVAIKKGKEPTDLPLLGACYNLFLGVPRTIKDIPRGNK